MQGNQSIEMGTTKMKNKSVDTTTSSEMQSNTDSGLKRYDRKKTASLAAKGTTRNHKCEACVK